MRIVKLIVGKGLSREQNYGKEWSKRYFQVEAELGPNDQLDQVKQQLETQLEEWLK